MDKPNAVPFRIGRIESGRKESNLLIPVLAGARATPERKPRTRELRAHRRRFGVEVEL